MKKRAIVAAMLLFAALLLAGCARKESGGSSGQYTLRISTSQTDQSFITRAYATLAERLNERSGGRLDVTVFPSGQLGSD